jgi:hypothetical protein
VCKHYSPPLYQLSYGEIGMGLILGLVQGLDPGLDTARQKSASSGSRTRAQTLATFDHNR